jgi:hypothetical protein
MNNPFDAPPEGALAQHNERAISVQYKANKTPENYAETATDAALPTFVANGALGFQYYDKEQKKKVPIPEFTFVVLDIYVGVSGYHEASRISYWSNRVTDSRTEPITVFQSGTQGPIFSGIYQVDIKPRLAEFPGASYTKFVKAYCVQLDKVVEIELTVSAERGMQKGIAKAEIAAGRLKFDWQKAYILSLAANDHLWGFHLIGYQRETKQGDPYAGKGELYFSPDFHCGIVNPVKQPALYAKCSELQDRERAAHEAYKARYSAPAQVVEQVPRTEPMPAPNLARAESFPTQEMQTDDLPF